MKSSRDEFLLLLNKWSSEGTLLQATATFDPPDGPQMVCRVSGTLAVEEASATFSITGADGSVFLCNIAGNGFLYGTPADVPGEQLATLVDQQKTVEDFCILQSEGCKILLLSLKPTAGPEA